MYDFFSEDKVYQQEIDKINKQSLIGFSISIIIGIIALISFLTFEGKLETLLKAFLGIR